MGNTAIRKINYDSPIQKALLFMLCFGRMDGLLYEEKSVFVFLIAIAGLGLMFNFLSGNLFYKEKFFIWQVALLAFFLCSILWAYSREQAITIWVAYLGRSIVMLYIFSYIYKTKNYNSASKIFVIATTLVCIHFLMAFGISGMLAARAEIVDIGQGWNANALGMQSVVSCFLIFNIIYRVKNNKIYMMAILPFLIFFILLTGSKTCFLLLFGSMMFTSFLRSNKKIFTVSIISISVVILSFLILNVPFLYEIIGERMEIMINGFTSFDVNSATSTEGSASDNLRMLMILQGWTWFLEQPWFGHGIGNFQELFGEINNGKEMYAHNNYIELLVDIGVIGAIIYYWLYIYVIYKSIKNHNRYDLSVAAFMIILMVAEFGHVSYLVFCIQFLLCLFMSRLGDNLLSVVRK